MSPPPLRVYAVLWLVLGGAFGTGAWFLWGRIWIAVAAGVVLGGVGLIVLTSLSAAPREPGGPRGPDDPRA